MVYKFILAVLFIVLCRKLVSTPKGHKLFPVWATFEVAIASYILRGNGPGRFILSSLRRYRGSLFGITSTHQILVNLPGLDRFMSQSSHTLSAEPVQYTLFTQVFGGVDSPERKKKLESSFKDLLAPIERIFLNDAAATAPLERAYVPQKAASFVSFSSDSVHMKQWELSADIRIIKPNLPGRPGIPEANLQSLTRDCGACMAIPLLYGNGFLNRYPELLDDFWKFDNDLFPLLMIGIPPWAPFKMVKEGRAA